LLRFARNDGKHAFASPRRDAPGAVLESFALKDRGRRECRVSDAPAARVHW